MTVAAQKEEKKKDSGSYRGCKLFLSKDGLEVVRVDCGVASIPPFRIDIPLLVESIQFCAEMTRVESDDKLNWERYSDHHACL